jgi:hypothetical protein
MFGFVRLVAKAFIRSGETSPPNLAGTSSSLLAILGADCSVRGAVSAVDLFARLIFFILFAGAIEHKQINNTLQLA